MRVSWRLAMTTALRHLSSAIANSGEDSAARRARLGTNPLDASLLHPYAAVNDACLLAVLIPQSKPMARGLRCSRHRYVGRCLSAGSNTRTTRGRKHTQMSNEDNNGTGAGQLTESLLLQGITLSVKALIATHQRPDDLRKAMQDLFAQFQSSAAFLNLSPPQRNWTREMFSGLLPTSLDTEQ